MARFDHEQGIVRKPPGRSAKGEVYRQLRIFGRLRQRGPAGGWPSAGSGRRRQHDERGRNDGVASGRLRRII